MKIVSNDQISYTKKSFAKNASSNAVRRNADGQSVVQLPFKGDVSELLGESRSTVQKLFYALEQKLQDNSNLKDQYFNNTIS